MLALMALPKDIKWLTFDVYGTLIDWEKGVSDAFQKEADRDGFTLDNDQLIITFSELMPTIISLRMSSTAYSLM